MRSSTSSSDSPAPDGRAPAPFPGRALLAVAALLAAAVAAGQWAPPTPAILTGSAQSMRQYESFRAHVERDGPHDFLVLGNSVARQGVRTRGLAERLQARTGRPAVGYNFASGGVTASALPLMTRLAYGIDQPPLCIVIVNPPMVAIRTPMDRILEERFLSSPYGLAVGDSLRWRGALKRALLDNVGLFRWRYALKDRLVGEPPASRRVGTYDEAAGYAVIEATPEDLAWGTVKSRYRNWSMAPELRAALAEAVRAARERGASVVLVETPRHPDTGMHVPDLDRKLEEYRTVLREVGASAGAHVLLLDGGLPLSEADFLDTHHLNERGAEAFTLWIADRLPGELLPR